MKLAFRMKNWLIDNLSLSSKLRVRRLIAGSVRPFALVAAGIQPRRSTLAHSVASAPRLSEQDLLAVTAALANKHAQTQTVTGSIRASVVIPVCNKAEFTLQCLRSLLDEIDLTITEVIVVNNASTDETTRVLACFKDFIRVVNNKENVGFVDACDQGAAAALGEFLVFLNNDKIVLPGWLENLLYTVENDASVGAAGSMFLYADGKIREAGGIVWKTGEAYPYGSGKSPDDRRFNFAREVDYCSAASLLIRKNLFDHLGGFDRRFAPAYYEDVDLCFGVRSLGYKVVYQPASRLIHYEGATGGTNTGASLNPNQLINRRKFHEKWRQVLEREHFDNNPGLAEEAANRKAGPQIIVFDDRVPIRDRDAGSARMANILKALAHIGRPVFVPMKPLPEYEQLLWKDGIETANVVDYVRLIKKRNFRVAVLSRPEVAAALLPLLRRLNRTMKIVFDMVDASFIRLAREYAITGVRERAEEARHFEALELNLAQASDQVWCASPADKKAVSKKVAEERIVVVPTIHALKGRGKPWVERDGLLFIGHLSHRPNSDAIHYFMREIHPLIKQCLPSTNFYIVGSNASAEINAYNSDTVKVMGYVPDIDPLFQSARVFVAPLRFGAGVNGKIGESLSYALPVVTTSLGAEGLGLIASEHALIADDPKEFADNVLRLYQDRNLWHRLADNGYRHIEKGFSPRVVGDTIQGGLSSLGVLDENEVRQTSVCRDWPNV